MTLECERFLACFRIPYLQVAGMIPHDQIPHLEMRFVAAAGDDSGTVRSEYDARDEMVVSLELE